MDAIEYLNKFEPRYDGKGCDAGVSVEEYTYFFIGNDQANRARDDALTLWTLDNDIRQIVLGFYNALTALAGYAKRTHRVNVISCDYLMIRIWTFDKASDERN